MSAVTSLRREHEVLGGERRERPRLEFPRNPHPRPDELLSSCQGYEVDVPEGRLGVVTELRFGRRYDRPDLLVVRTGRLRRRAVLVPVELVEEIVPVEERLVLRCVPAADAAGSRSRRSGPSAPRRSVVARASGQIG
ncbi:MAG: hypothetical protein ACXVYM_05575 [Gaiellaceae bacterium]